MTSVLQERWPAAEVRAVETQPLGEGVGLNSVLARLAIDVVGAAEAPRRMIVKLPAAHPAMRTLAERYRAYEREVNFYRRFAARVPIDTPDVYCARADGPGRFILLLEDLSGLRAIDHVRGASIGCHPCGRATRRAGVRQP